MPKFNEEDVPKFFDTFERVASQLSWPKEHWPILLQSSLVGKAQVAYSSLSVDDSANYDAVKSAILKCYELVPEAYRQRFRDLRKTQTQTYMDFARNKEHLFNEWCRSKNIADYEGLRGLILVEEFKRCIPKEIRTHLEEVQIDTLDKAASVSDEYALTHKGIFQSKDKGKVFNKTTANQGKEGDSKSSSTSKVECYYCHKLGHVKSQCHKFKKDQASSGEKKPVGLIGKVKSHPVDPLDSKLRSAKVSSSLDNFKDYMSVATVAVSADSPKREITVLRDTGAAQSLILENALPEGFEVKGNEVVLLGGFPDTVVSRPLETFYLDSTLTCGYVRLAIVECLPVAGVDLLLANDLARGIVGMNPVVIVKPENMADKEVKYPVEDILPVNVVTRSRAKKLEDTSDDVLDSLPTIFDTGVQRSSLVPETSKAKGQVSQNLAGNREELILAQENDEELQALRNRIGLQDKYQSYFLKDKILMRRYHPIVSGSNESWKTVEQIVVPVKYRDLILEKSHEDNFSGHFGVQKTLSRILKCFYWPKIKQDVVRHCKTCHQCQVIGKPNQNIAKAPLLPIPSVGEPFQNVVIDIVGPLPRTKSGHEYILTIIDRTSRYPEAIPLRSIKSPIIVRHLIEFFTKFGLPRTIQSDQGSNFTSKYFQDRMKQLGVDLKVSSAYHPESQGVVERFHQTLKSMIKKYCLGNGKSWDTELPFLLFAIRSAPNSSLGFSPFELIFGHSVRGPLEIIRDLWDNEDVNMNLLDWVTKFRSRLTDAWKFAGENLLQSQQTMKINFDKKAKARTLEEGQLVLILLPNLSNQLKASFSGPYKILKKLSETNYVVETPDRKKNSQVCHINMIKPYFCRDVKAVACMASPEIVILPCEELKENAWPKTNSEALANLNSNLSHLSSEQSKEIEDLVLAFPDLFSDTPGKTHLISHDVDVEGASPIKQHPYRLHPEKSAIVKTEVEYMLKNDLVVPSSSPWSSPIVLVKKPHDQHRLCFDYRKVNAVTKTDTFPLPRVNDCIDRVGNAKFISKFDLLKGYWQVPLTERAQKISAFITADGLYECKVMPFGMKNAASTFQRLMTIITKDLEGCVVYLDDIVIYSDSWEDHLRQVRDFFLAIRAAGLVINLAKSEFGKTSVTYLGHEIGCGVVAPKNKNVQAILDFSPPKNRKQVMSFLGLAGYYRRFVSNFADISSPLTDLLKKGVSFDWNDRCQHSFDKLKAILTSYPVLRAPDFSKPFKLAVDASDIGIGSVLLQEDSDGIEHPCAYFSKKLLTYQRRYSTIEKEALGLILALSHFEVYISASTNPLVVYMDHNPLRFLHKFNNKNQRLTRWSLLLQEYNLDIRHIKGKDNVVPDVLSRI